MCFLNIQSLRITFCIFLVFSASPSVLEKINLRRCACWRSESLNLAVRRHQLLVPCIVWLSLSWEWDQGRQRDTNHSAEVELHVDFYKIFLWHRDWRRHLQPTRSFSWIFLLASRRLPPSSRTALMDFSYRCQNPMTTFVWQKVLQMCSAPCTCCSSERVKKFTAAWKISSPFVLARIFPALRVQMLQKRLHRSKTKQRKPCPFSKGTNSGLKSLSPLIKPTSCAAYAAISRGCLDLKRMLSPISAQ